MLKKFNKNNLFRNTIKTHPKRTIFVYDKKVYIDNITPISGVFESEIAGTKKNYLDLYELNVDRPTSQYIYPFITKDGSLSSFKTISTTDFNSDFSYGDTITGSYPLYASISRDRYSTGQARSDIDTLQNTLNYYKKNSNHYAYTSSFGNKATQEISLISIPSMFYGSSIEKGSIKCDFYVTGTLIGRLEDTKRNGELIQTLPYGSNGSGSVAGVVLYSEGFMCLTGAWNIVDTHTEPYVPGEAAKNPQWLYYFSTGSTGASENLPSSSFSMEFKGTQYVNVITMICDAEEGEFNFSNNPTFIKSGQGTKLIANTSSFGYKENDKIEIKNVTYSPHTNATSSFQKTTYISEVAIYDDDKNLLGIARLSTPLRKKEKDNFSIKIKIDV